MWPKIQRDRQEKVTVESLAFESVTGSECRSWWDETPPDHALKNSLRKAEVDHAIQMPTFNIKYFEPVLRTMVAGYDSRKQKSIIEY